MIIETRRLVLTPLGPSHFAAIVNIASSRVIADTTISVPHPLEEKTARSWFEDLLRDARLGRSVSFAIGVGPTIIGYIAVKSIDPEHKEAELSFWLDDDFAGQGYVSEAADAVAEFAFKTLRLNRLCAYHMARNPAPGRILSKVGFQQEGLLRQRVRKWGVYEDVALWAKLSQHE